MRYSPARKWQVRAWLAAVVMVVQYQGAAAAEPPATGSGLFQSDTTLPLRLEARFATFINKREGDRAFQPAQIAYTDAGGATVTTDLQVRIRGKSRAMATTCDFPPLLLDFPAKALSGTLFDGENRLKLVTYCRNDADYEQFILLEYLIYRALNLLTDTSLRVRLAEVTYYDTGRQREIATRPGILIENEARAATRMGGRPLEVAAEIARERYDQNQLRLVEVFEYFIGNTDWSAKRSSPGLDCCHNVVPVETAGGVLLPVPYDFDSSGVVNTPYALPNEKLPIRKVRQRLFRGACYGADELQATFALFQTRRADITALFATGAGLTKTTARATVAYLDKFYDTIADPKRQQKAFMATCAK